MKAIQIIRYGEKLRVRRTDIPIRKSNELLIKINFSPINPSDLYMGLGVYGYRPKLPSILGFEGVGTIIESDNHY